MRRALRNRFGGSLLRAPGRGGQGFFTMELYGPRGRLLIAMISQLGRSLMILGLALFLTGLLLYVFPRLPVRLGRLPGDIVIRGKNSVFYFPLMTSLLLSLLFSVLLWLFRRR